MHVLTPAQVERDCRAFAATYPTPNVRRAVQLAESGRITWAQAYGLFRTALEAGIAAVAS